MGGYLSVLVPFSQGSLPEKPGNQASSQEGDQTVSAGIMETEMKAMLSFLIILSVSILVLRRGCAAITFPHCWGPSATPLDEPVQPCPGLAQLRFRSGWAQA